MVATKPPSRTESLPISFTSLSKRSPDLKSFKKELKIIKTLIGENYEKKPLSVEDISRTNARRSIVLLRDLEENDTIDEKDIIYKRPGTGISPYHWDEVIGKKVKKNLKEDHILMWEDLIN